MEEKDRLKDKKTSHKPKKDNVIITVLKKHKIGILLVIFLFMVSSTFAWFVFNRTVSMSLTTHVKAWNIELGDDDDGDTYVIEIADLYPGMATIDTEAGGGIPITNNGEIAADISVDIVSITLFGELQELGVDYTLEKRQNNSETEFVVSGYPFVLTFKLSSDYLVSGASTALNYSLEWVYENTDPSCYKTDADGETYNQCDIDDTYYGEKSYDFSIDSPNSSSLVIEMKMNVTQSNA